MKQIRYIALLRGINVGGNNIIKMTDLKSCFEEMGFSDVTTYIQSGNVLFSTENNDKERLTETIETVLSEKFNYQSCVILITAGDLHHIIQAAPAGFGDETSVYKYNVAFLKSPLTAGEALNSIRLKEGVDQAYAGRDVLYFVQLTEKAGNSYLAKIASHPIYKKLTIRNWNTTTKLRNM